MDQIRHTYLHYLIEPLVYARASAMDRLLPLLKPVQDAPLEFIPITLPWWARLLIPAVGGLIAGSILLFGQRLSTVGRAADFMEAVVVGDGVIRVRATLVKSLSSLVTISSGGSIGREGSMVQLSSMAGSLLGRATKVSPARLRLMVACGAAAGIACAYNAPLTGAFFVAEIVLGSIAMESIGPLIVAVPFTFMGTPSG